MQWANEEETTQTLLTALKLVDLQSSSRKYVSKKSDNLLDEPLASRLSVEQERRRRKREMASHERIDQRHREEFLDWIENAGNDSTWMRMQDLRKAFRFAVRRPFLPELDLRNYLESIGINCDYDKSHDSLNNVRPGTPVPEYASLIDWPGRHVSVFRDYLPKGRGLEVIDCIGGLVPRASALPYNPLPRSHQSISRDGGTTEPLSGAMYSQSKEQLKLECDEQVEEQVEDLANAITLYRSGNYSLERTVDVLLEVTVGLEIDLDHCIMQIKASGCGPQETAIDIIDDTLHNQPPHSDDSDEEQDTPSQERHDRQAQPPFSKSKISLKYDTVSRLQSIYHDFLEGVMDVRDGPNKFRSALGNPDMEDSELASLITKHGIPAELFFAESTIDGQSKMDDDSIMSHSKPSIIPDRGIKAEPIHLNANADDGEAETPAGFEYHFDIILPNSEPANGDMSSSKSTNSDPSLSIKTVNRDELSSSSPVTSPSREMPPPLAPVAKSYRSSSVVWSGTGPYATSQNLPADPRSPKASPRDNVWPIQGTAGMPTVEQVEIDKRSTSPVNGVTNSLWGITMPTREAREWCRQHNLPSKFITDGVRSNTPFRQSAKKASKLSNTVSLIPSELPAKRRLSVSSSGSRSHKLLRYDSDLAVFADEGEDHKSFMCRFFSEYDIVQAAAGASSRVKLVQKRCWGCGCQSCICRAGYSASSSTRSQSRHKSLSMSGTLLTASFPLANPKPLRKSLVQQAFGDDKASLQALNELAGAKLRSDMKRARSLSLPSEAERRAFIEGWKNDPRHIIVMERSRANSPTPAGAEEFKAATQNVATAQSLVEETSASDDPARATNTISDTSDDDSRKAGAAVLEHSSNSLNPQARQYQEPTTPCPASTPNDAPTLEPFSGMSPFIEERSKSPLRLVSSKDSSHGSVLAGCDRPATDSYVNSGNTQGPSTSNRSQSDGLIWNNKSSQELQQRSNLKGHRKKQSVSTALRSLSLEPVTSPGVPEDEFQSSKTQSSELEGSMTKDHVTSTINAPGRTDSETHDTVDIPPLPPTPYLANKPSPLPPRLTSEAQLASSWPADKGMWISADAPSRYPTMPAYSLPSIKGKEKEQQNIRLPHVSSLLQHMDWEQNYEDLEGDPKQPPSLDSSSGTSINPPPLPGHRLTIRPELSAEEQLSALEANCKSIVARAAAARAHARKLAEWGPNMQMKKPNNIEEISGRNRERRTSKGSSRYTAPYKSAYLGPLYAPSYLLPHEKTFQRNEKFGKANEDYGSRYFQGNVPTAGKSASSTSNTPLNKLFDKYRGMLSIVFAKSHCSCTHNTQMTPPTPTQSAQPAPSNTSRVSASSSTNPPCSPSTPNSPLPPSANSPATASSPAGRPSAPKPPPSSRLRSPTCAPCLPPTKNTSRVSTNTLSSSLALPVRKTWRLIRRSTTGGSCSVRAVSPG